MKNASQIITTLQYKPQFSKILEFKCIERLKSSLLPAYQKHIRYGYIKNHTLSFVTSGTLGKHDIDTIINNIKMVLNSPMILESENFCECLDIKIDEIVVKRDYRPPTNFKPFKTTSHLKVYAERASGLLGITIKDKKLNNLAQQIQEIIKEKNDTNR